MTRRRAGRALACLRAGVAALALLGLLGAAACGRYGPPTREARFRAPTPVAETPVAADETAGEPGAEDPRGDAGRTDGVTTTEIE